MDNTKYLAGISIVGLVLILGLTMSVSAMPYISIGDTTHNFTLVPGQDADITLPIMVKNTSDSPVKGLQFNVTFNCSMINITDITEVNIVNVSNAPQKTELYNKLCNNSDMPTGLQKVFCVYMNTSLTSNNKTNASILFASVKNLGNNNCVLRIAFASYESLAGDVGIGKIKMHVKGMPSYLNGSSINMDAILPMNITIEKMGRNNSANGHVNISDASIHSQARVNGLIKACRGDANKNGGIDLGDKMLLIRATLTSQNPNYYGNLTLIKECVDLNGNGGIDLGDKMLLIRATLTSQNPNYYNLSANIDYN